MASEIRVTNIKANDGTSSLTVANSTGAVTAGQNLAVTGNTTVGGTLTSTGNFTTSGTLTSTGDTTLNNGNLVISTSGKGLDFDGRSRTAVLDDYEEGTWTAVMTSSGATFNAVTVGNYTKIGRLVHAKGSFDTSSGASGTLTNAFTINGLPFTSDSDNMRAPGSLSFYIIVNMTGYLGMSIHVNSGTDYLQPYFISNDASPASVTAAAFDWVDSRLAFSVSYYSS